MCMRAAARRASYVRRGGRLSIVLVLPCMSTRLVRNSAGGCLPSVVSNVWSDCCGEQLVDPGVTALVGKSQSGVGRCGPPVSVFNVGLHSALHV